MAVFAISDIHGRTDRFVDVVNRAGITSNDKLIVMGDLIDRNKGGLKLMKKLSDMPNVTILLGNHELMMRDAMLFNGSWENWFYNGGAETYDEYTVMSAVERAEILMIIAGLPTEKRLTVNGRKFTLCHAAPTKYFSHAPGKKSETDIETAAVWYRAEPGEVLEEGRTVIFGHTPTCYYNKPRPWRFGMTAASCA